MTKVKNFVGVPINDYLTVKLTVKNDGSVVDLSGGVLSSGYMTIKENYSDSDGAALSQTSYTFATDGTDGVLLFHAPLTGATENTTYYYDIQVVISGRKYTLRRGQIATVDEVTEA